MPFSSPNGLSRGARRISVVLTGLAAALGCSVAVALPVVLFSVRYDLEQSDLAAEAADTANRVSQHIYTNPELWQFEVPRLMDIVTQVTLPGHPVRRRILDAGGRVVVDTGEELPAPTITRTAPIQDGRQRVGTLELEQSIEPLLTRGITEGLLSLLVGAAIFVVVRVIPVHAVRVTFSRLEESQEALLSALHAAQAADKAKAEFLATMSHELRTPLNAIIGFSEMIAGQMLGPVGTPTYVEYSRDIHASGQHLLTIINDVLDFSKAAAGKLEVGNDPVDVAAAARSAIMFVMPQAAEGKVTIDSRVAPGLPAIRGDERRIRQALVNLLSNAVKFSPGGTVTVEADCAADGDLVLRVRDTGVGIAEADMERVLRPFEQSDGGYARVHEGTGLGLPLTKHLVEAHGGTLTLASRLGAGTTVSLRFPASRLEAGTEPLELRGVA
jgi:signal transduction histidine kinase